MGRGKQIQRRQQRQAAAAAKKGFSEFADTNPLAKKIAGAPWIMNEYRRIYNKCCPDCRALIQRTGGRAKFKDYCSECQKAASPHLKNIQVMLGRTKEQD